MTAIDQKWVVPLLLFGLIVFIGITHLPASSVWYDSVEDYQINTIEVEELAGWIIQGRNHFMPIILPVEDPPSLNNIPGLIYFDPDQYLEDQVSAMPTYKKWIVITPDGTLPSPEAAILTKDWKRRIILLKGGANEWNSKITAETLEGVALSQKQRTALNHVRPFFHRDSEFETKGTEGTEPQDRYIAPVPASPPLLQNIEMEADEGC